MKARAKTMRWASPFEIFMKEQELEAEFESLELEVNQLKTVLKHLDNADKELKGASEERSPGTDWFSDFWLACTRDQRVRANAFNF